jgi:glutathione synthase/RimK-type ligase-like ATP-grasp enzyme
MAMARRATALMGYDVAGVNVLQGRRTQQWYLLEVNCAPAIGSGTFATEKTRAYARYLQTRLA